MTRRFSFSRFDRVTIGAFDYQSLETTQDGARLMRLDGTGTVEQFDHVQLQSLRESPTWRYHRNWFRPAGLPEERIRPSGTVVSALSPEKQDYLAWLLNIMTVVHEMRAGGEITLSNAGTDAKRPLICQRVNEREVARIHIGRKPRSGRKAPVRDIPSTRTILKMYRRYLRSGCSIDAFIPRVRIARVPSHVDHEAEELLRECILSYASPQRPSKTEVFENTSKRFREENERRRSLGLREVKAFSRRTVDRHIDRLDPFMVACHREGADRARAMFATAGAGLPKLYPMQRIELDEWLVDVRTWFGRLGIFERLPDHVRKDLPSGRRWVCAAIDVATRCVLGIRLAADPSSVEAVRLLRQVVQDKTDLARAVGANADWAYFGGLGEVAADGGSAFQSTPFITAVTDLHGNIHFPPVGIPELRATIERFFGTASTKLMPLLSGRTFRSPDARGDYDSEARTVLDDEDLLRILIKWIVDDYHHAPHVGLGGDSPATRWKNLAAQRFVVEAPDRRDRRVALGVELRRTLSKQGITVATNSYSCPELRQKYRHGNQRKFRVRIDPDDIGSISILIDGGWVDAPSIHGDLDGITLDGWRLQLAHINQRYRDEAELSRSMREAALAEIRATNAQRVAQLLPGSMTTTAEQIEALEQTDFAGKTWNSSTGASSKLGAFFAELTDSDTQAPIRDAETERPEGPNRRASWSLDDE